MTIRHFGDTDAAVIVFRENETFDAHEVSEDVYIDVDRDGNLVSMTIERAKSSGGRTALKGFPR